MFPIHTSLNLKTFSTQIWWSSKSRWESACKNDETLYDSEWGGKTQYRSQYKTINIKEVEMINGRDMTLHETVPFTDRIRQNMPTIHFWGPSHLTGSIRIHPEISTSTPTHVFVLEWDPARRSFYYQTLFWTSTKVLNCNHKKEKKLYSSYDTQNTILAFLLTTYHPELLTSAYSGYHFPRISGQTSWCHYWNLPGDLTCPRNPPTSRSHIVY